MTDIALGQSIAGSLTAADPKIGSQFYDEYNLNLDSFRQLIINIGPSAATAVKSTVALINSDTGAIVSENSIGRPILLTTTFPGVNYKVRVSGTNPGDYNISAVDGGKATSIVTNSNNGQFAPFGIGTVGASGVYFPLVKGNGTPLSDVAIAPNGQFYGLATVRSGNFLVRIDPSLALAQQVTIPPLDNESRDTIKDTDGQPLVSTLNALEFGADNQLYSTGVETTGAKFYQIDVNNNNVATVVANLPAGLGSAGDLVYDSTNNRFLAVAQDTATSDALWQIPVNNPSGASKIGQIGFTRVEGIDFENGQLTGFTTSATNATSPTTIGNRIKINASSGVGTIDRAISSTEINNQSYDLQSYPGLLIGSGISGASTILAATPTPNPNPNPTPTPTPNPNPNPTPNPTPIAGINLNNNLFVTDTTLLGFTINSVSQKAGSKVNEIGVFAVDDATGKIGGIAPGTAGYLKAATDSAKTIFSALNSSFFSTSARDVGLDANKTYQFFQVQDGSIADVQQQIASGKTPTNVLFSLPGSTGTSPFKITANGANDYNISINNDEIVLKGSPLASATPNVPIGAKSQGLAQGRSIDLSDTAYVSKTLKADIVTKSDAGYSNTIGFYVVDDVVTGQISTAAGKFKPGDIQYAAEAIKSAVSSLSVNKTDSKTGLDILGGKIYAPVVVAQGTLTDFVSKNIDNNSTDPNAIHAYFNYLGANPDKLDYFRLLGNNTLKLYHYNRAKFIQILF